VDACERGSVNLADELSAAATQENACEIIDLSCAGRESLLECTTTRQPECARPGTCDNNVVFPADDEKHDKNTQEELTSVSSEFESWRYWRIHPVSLETMGNQNTHENKKQDVKKEVVDKKKPQVHGSRLSLARLSFGNPGKGKKYAPSESTKEPNTQQHIVEEEHTHKDESLFASDAPAPAGELYKKKLSM